MDKFQITDIRQAVLKRQFPTITLWNRLEGRPRADNFDRALRNEVRDALWMLCKQWQMGEFRGDDAGSPVSAKLHLTTTRLTKYAAADQPVQVFENDVPLETKVEQRPIPFMIDQQIIALDSRLLMGRYWLKLIAPLGNFRAAFVEQYPIALPDPGDSGDAPVCAHAREWQQFAAVAERSMDGAALVFYLKQDSAHHAYDGIMVPEDKKDDVDEQAAKFIQWFDNLVYQPREPENNAWRPSYLEYQFACSAPEGDGEKVFRADEYYHGHLDWYNLDVDNSAGGLGEPADPPPPDPQDSLTTSFIPVPIEFEGMPNTRWWTFEDGKTNFGDINPSTTEIAKLLLIEFGLVYANDWFLMPLTLPVGTVTSIKGITVSNVFGERIWIDPAGKGTDEDWQRWNMYTLNTQGEDDDAADLRLLLLPSVPKIQESQPLETASMVRDEIANMVWGVEQTIPMPSGQSQSGREAARETLHFHTQRSGAVVPEPETTAKIRYQVMNSVPENWIPFIPVHMEGSNREIQLQRAGLPRIIEGSSQPPVKVRPRGALLRHGLDQSSPQPYFVHEEEVPRAGVQVRQTFQRTRWYNGGVFVWLGVRKQTGRGEAASGLAFDQIRPVKKQQGT